MTGSVCSHNNSCYVSLRIMNIFCLAYVVNVKKTLDMMNMNMISIERARPSLLCIRA